MSRSPQSRIISLATSAVLATGVGMIPLHRLPYAVRAVYVVLPAAAGAGVVLAALRRVPARPAEEGSAPAAPRRTRRRQVTRAALPLVVGGLIAGAGAASLVIDRGIENSLRRRGVPAPRVAMGLASGALSLVMDVLSDRGEGPEPAPEGAEPTSAPSAR
ncbi:hypothetical protein CFK38_11965 [Brachybacterium vulturis]|uniref:Uncharacterized protein n=1 Tax=Brachybacterium vulturis TaxID=2017484 RepID=A0A291GPN3_9MICO|nr:hypothetical protein [Brachybacterium vulturis]ATG52158.1 hypothetical protein CFK38_11965 [Brachybacterium vulturis]